MLILGIETSCDETAAAVVKDGKHILSAIVHSQIKDHHKFGGVVPEIASRKHIEYIIQVVDTALYEARSSLKKIDALAVTCGPGLIGSLLIGLSVAKALAFSQNLPIIAIDHLEAHIYASFLMSSNIEFPFLSFIISGGHTDIYLVKGHGNYTLLGQTRDDAAGEAFDKVAKMLGLGYPGGPIISKLAVSGNPSAIHFPRAHLGKNSLDFSFSGLKTSVFNYLKEKENRTNIPDIAASFQEAVVDMLVNTIIVAQENQKVATITVGGGVASNRRLHDRLCQEMKKKNIHLLIPPPHLCTDNAAMIACAAYYNRDRMAYGNWSLNATSRRFITVSHSHM
ncbi:MAG: tRNA (adenosine(37)-N6)-threonylcarbamoyltransferase complex transferase subunit TsaD [bacterium]